MTDKISRRTLGGVAAAGVGLPLLAACGDDADTAGDAGPTSSDPSTAQSSSAPSPSASTSGSASGGGATPEGFTSTEDVPVGGGTVFIDEEVVVTQPTSGEFKCFTAICTHQGCLVTDVSDGTINCDCHGSRYDIETGEVEQGPATFPLDEVPISVSGDQIALA